MVSVGQGPGQPVGGQLGGMPGGAAADQGDEDGGLIIPTAETVKQTFFLKMALGLGIPLGRWCCF